jgi:predicted transcriptional regulator
MTCCTKGWNLSETKSEIATTPFLTYTATIVAAYISQNPLATADLPTMIKETYSALTGLVTPDAPVRPEQKPAVDVKKSVFPDYIICLEDGKQMKMLKRHLATSYSLTPEEYRAKWGLAPSYPMVAPNYAKTRSALAKASGLGKKAPPKRKRK